MKRFLSVILSLSIAFSCFMLLTAEASATETEASVLKFSCGLDATAYLDRESGTLTVKGAGEMELFRAARAPWWAYNNEIKYVVVEEGITKIASVAFLNTNMTKLTIPSTLVEIGADALSMTDLEEIVVPENSKLSVLYVSNYFRNIPWYKNQPDGPVYLGKLLVDYKGTMPDNTTVTVKEGTYAINECAFYNQSNLKDVIVPDSVERIGYRAFYETGWYNSKPDCELIYIGKILYHYKTPWNFEEDVEDELVIPEGIVSISSEAFDGRCNFKTVVIPDSLEHIGVQAFYKCYDVEKIEISENSSLKTIDTLAFNGCKYLESIYLPEGLEVIGWSPFTGCSSLSEIRIPSTVKKMGLTVFDPSSLDLFEVDENNPYFCTDEDGVLYNKDKTTVIASYQIIDKETKELPATVTKISPQAFATTSVKNFILPEGVVEIGFEAFAESEIESINLPYGIKRIYEYAFNQCGNLKEIVIPKSTEFIDTNAFAGCYGLKKAVIPAQVKYIGVDAFLNDYGVTFYCYDDTAAYYYATENNIKYSLLLEPDMSHLDSVLEEYKKLEREKYIPETLVGLDEAAEAVDMTITVITQDMVDNWVADIENAMNQLEYVPADYSEIDSAKARAETVDRSLYTPESLAKLDGAISSVDETLDVSDQKLVAEYAKAINDAIDNLQYLPADYTRVNEAVAESEKLDRILYSQATLAVLDQSVSAIDYTLNITQQAIVDGFADRIHNAMDSLLYADVVLRDEPNGVVVSATAKEIYPVTTLTVDMLDPSAIENANFAVGGNIKSVSYYDINLIREGEKVQPEGTVYVKIRIPDGVKPEKCRVYHVTDDPVDPLVRFASTLDGNYIVFETDHFSEFAVIEVDTYLSGISVTKMPVKLTYGLNEKTDFADMQITAIYSDGKSELITDYDISNVDTSSVGTKTVTVYYTFGEITKSASFEITVSAGEITADIMLGGQAINEYNQKVKWYKFYSAAALQLECSLNKSENYNINWTSDNKKVTVDENGKVTCKGILFAQKATITVNVTDSAGNVIASDKIIVRFYKFNFQFSGIQNVFVPPVKKLFTF